MHGAARTLGPYRLVRELARGGMGAVHEAVHEVTGARHAVKTLLPAGLGGADEVELRRFRREVEVLGQLEHPHVVRVHAACLDGPTPWLAQDLLTGGSLQRRLELEGPLPVEQAVAIARDLALALEHAHARGVLHRDLKPHNVLFDDQGAARLVDFGLTRHLGGTRLTATGAVLGTPAFMAPEQALAAGAVDARSDLYGLGATLWAMLVGRPPFEGASVWAVLEQVTGGDVRAPSRLRRDVPAWLDAVVLKAMARDPAARFGTAAALAAALAQGGPRRRRWPLALGASGAAVVLAVVAVASASAAFVAAGPPSSPTATTPSPPTVARRADDAAQSPRPSAGEPAPPRQEPASFVARDGSTLLWIPGATVTVEYEDERSGAHVRRDVAVDGFYLARDEVTWAQVRAFRRDARREPSVDSALSERACPPEESAHPVRPDEALAYCDYYAGLRLPTEAEWVLAAFGADGRRWPWGDEEPTPERASLCFRDEACGDLTHHPRPPGRPLGASPFGCRDMIGNVSEWVADLDEHGDPIRRGGDAGAHTEVRGRRERRTGRGVERGQGFRVAASRAAARRP